MPTTRLADRALITVEGPDAEHFLQNILTVDLDGVASGVAAPGALLSPQGKILFDFLVSRTNDGFRLDCRADIADDFVRRLTLYKLRAKVQISRLDQPLVAASWGTESSTSQPHSGDPDTGITVLRDVRFRESLPVWRLYGEGSAPDDLDGYTRLRIQAGIAESGADYQLGDAFPHDVLLDQTGGVGFRKGCYIGQEVVSRMQHRGTARRRVLIASAAAPLPPAGTEILAGGRPVGSLGTVAGRNGLAIARIHRVKDAMDGGHALLADSTDVSLTIPDWASFSFPSSTEGAET